MNGQASVLRQIGTLFDAGAIGSMSDADLLDRFARGGTDAELAFEALVGRHGPMVLATCRRILRDDHAAHDAFQATFLVLARKAASVGRRDRLAGWLHGVASRTAMKVRSAAARRSRHERARASESPEIRPTPDDASDLRAALLEEIARLPARYREPVVLCHLEGLSRERASAHLQCPESTVGVRLMRARERLKAGLIRRGFAVEAGGVAFDVGGEVASAALPGGLAATTARAAAAFASDHTAGIVSAPVLDLARGALIRMRTTRLMALVPALLVSGALAAGGGAVLTRPNPPEPAPPAPVVASAPPKADEEPRWKKTLTGGVTVELLGVSPEQHELKTWWGPDGSPLDAPPYATLGTYSEVSRGMKPRTFAVRVSGVPEGSDVGLLWKIAETSGVSSASHTLDKDSRPVPGTFGATARFPESTRGATARIGVAAGPWETRGTSAGGGVTSVGGARGAVMFSRARETKDGVALCAVDTYVRDEIETRVVAVDREGQEHRIKDGGWIGDGEPRALRFHDVTFSLPLDQIREFRFQTRPYEWVTFRDVALDPAARP